MSPVVASTALAGTWSVTIAALGAGAAGAFAVWRAPSRLGGARIAGLGLGAVVAVAVVAVFLLLFVGLRFFGVAHLTYLCLVLAIPMVGVALGARVFAGEQLARPWTGAALLLILPGALGWYGTHVAPFRLEVDRVTVALDSARAGDDPVRIGVLADLQTNDVGDHEHAAVDKLLAEEPDLILVPGDLFQGTPAEFARHEDEMRELLGRLHAPHGVYFARGDVDNGDFADRALAGTDVVILDDEIVDVEVGDRTVRIGGNQLAYRNASAVNMRRDLATTTPADEDDDGTIRILMAHRPDAVLDLPTHSRVDLTVAGHTHGGQIVVPGVGPLMTLTDVPREVARGGLHEVDGNPIYVSTGVGMERAQAPQIRIFSPPSIGILTLR